MKPRRMLLDSRSSKPAELETDIDWERVAKRWHSRARSLASSSAMKLRSNERLLSNEGTAEENETVVWNVRRCRRRTFDNGFRIAKKRSVQRRVDLRLKALQIHSANDRIARLHGCVVRFVARAKNQFRVTVNTQGLDERQFDGVQSIKTKPIPSMVRRAMVHLFSIAVAEH